MKCKTCEEREAKTKGLCVRCYCSERRKTAGSMEDAYRDARDKGLGRELLENRVLKDSPGDCKLYAGSITPRGYGIVFHGYRGLSVHRVVAIEYGRAEIDDEAVLHTCPNSSCINPEHLYGGTLKQRMKGGNMSARRAVVSPDGREWESVAEAAKDPLYSGLPVSVVYYRAQNNLLGWRYTGKKGNVGRKNKRIKSPDNRTYRNKYLAALDWNLKPTTVILYARTERHGWAYA